MSETDNQKPASVGRRRLLGTLATGGAAATLLPEKWTRPVIDRILVPAHAQQVSITSVLYFTNQTQHGQSQSENLFERIADTLIPPAHANSVNVTIMSMGLALYPNSKAFLCVSGATGQSTWNGLAIQPITAAGCGSYTLSNATITNDMQQVNGSLSLNANITSIAFSVKLNRDNGLPPGCTTCEPLPPPV